jgi:predicted TIM-barrel fold metal-dependent hydrolase
VFTRSTQQHLVIDADSHVVEPVSLWAEHLPARYRERAPTLVDDAGTDWLVCEGIRLMSSAHMSGLTRRDASLPVDEALPESRWDTDVVKGGYDPDARLVDMETDGVDVGIVYPTVALTLYRVEDRELVGALFRAYNSWLADFCSAAPERLHGVGVLDADAPFSAVAEIERCRELGHVGLLVPLYDAGAADFGAPRWDPVWAAAEDVGLPIGFHAFVRGPGARPTVTESMMDALVERPARVERALLGLVLGHVFTRFPGLRVVSAENEAGWAGPMLERADTAFRRGRFRDLPGGPLERAPSELFREHVFLTVLDDRTALHARDVIGSANLLWSSDYPHNVSSWPRSAARIDGLVEATGLDEREIAQFVGANPTSGCAARSGRRRRRADGRGCFRPPVRGP